MSTCNAFRFWRAIWSSRDETLSLNRYREQGNLSPPPPHVSTVSAMVSTSAHSAGCPSVKGTRR